jgi:protein TonB
MVGEASLSPQLVLSPGARRALPMAVVAAALAHALVFTLLLIAPSRTLPEAERVTYDLVFVEPVAPATPEPQPEPTPTPTQTVEPPLELPTPTPPKPRPRPVAKAPAMERVPDDQPVRAGETAAVPAPPPVAAVAPPAASAPPRPAADPAYARTLLTWLNRYREYPAQARRRGIEGRVILFLVVERSGKISQLKVATSSGADVLDAAALNMARRADPMPPVPSGMTGDLIQFWIPVDFALSR